MFDKKNVTISDTMKVKLFTNCSQTASADWKGGFPMPAKKKAAKKKAPAKKKMATKKKAPAKKKR